MADKGYADIQSKWACVKPSTCGAVDLNEATRGPQKRRGDRAVTVPGRVRYDTDADVP